MSSLYLSIERVFVHPERLGWLWLVAVCLTAMVFGAIIRRRWRRRLFGLSRRSRVPFHGGYERIVRPAATFIALVMIALAVADPRAGMGAAEVRTANLQIVCLIDRSRSMAAEDATPNRFARAQTIVREAVEQAGGGAVALVTFAGEATVDVPLTRDYQGLLERLDRIVPGGNLSHGSNLHAGITTAATCFAERMESSKILIIVSDGETHGAEPALAGVSLPAGTEVLVIGVGDSQKGARIPLANTAGFRSDSGQSAAEETPPDKFLTYEEKVVWSKANPQLLTRLSTTLGGRFESPETVTTSTALAEVIRESERAGERQSAVVYQRQARPLFHWLLLGAFGLLALEMAWPSRNESSGADFHPAATAWLRVMMAVGCAGSMATAASAENPHRAVASESPARIAAKAEVLLDDSDVSVGRPSARELSQIYNRGVRAYRAKRWREAEALFRAVARGGKGELKSKATFNLGNALFAEADRGGMSQRAAIARLEAAIGAFQQCIADGRRVEDARVNIEIAYRRLLQIEQQPPEGSGDGESAPDDPGGNDPGEAGDGSGKGEGGENDDQRNQEREQQEGETDQGNGDSGEGPGDGSSPPAPDDGGPDAPDGNGSGGPESDEGPKPEGPKPEGPRTGGPPQSGGTALDDLQEPLADEQAESQLQRIRQRAREREEDHDQQESEPAAAAPAPDGLPW